MMLHSKVYLVLVLVLLCAQQAMSQEIVIQVDPTVSTAINGHLNLDRSKYFNLSTSGILFESTINNKTRSDYYIQDLEMTFGRTLGMVSTAVPWGGNVREDAARPGYADMAFLKQKSNPSNGTFSEAFKQKFPNNLDVANHDNHNAYPVFMPPVINAQAGDIGKLPSNVDAAAELAVALLKYYYTDWTRPKTFEPINEPHWAIDKDLLANLHMAIWKKAKAEKIPTLIGGPCYSTAYYYKKNYTGLSGLSDFIDRTECKLDFYSFHVYDFMKYDAARKDIVGRVTSGLPIEGVLDIVPNYTMNKYGKAVEIVISETGGYMAGREADQNAIANTYFPGSGFAWEMKRRSISAFVMVSSCIANTMAFINHPHVVKKSVPFILLESFAWDPKYYSSLLVANNFTDKNNWQESKYIHFYEFFKGVKGRRVLSECTNPDIQQHAFVDGNKLVLVMNNQSNIIKPLKVNLPASGISSINIRRFGRNTDFTPYLEEQAVASLNELSLKGREAMVITVTYQDLVQQSKYINEKAYYGAEISREFVGTANFTVNIPSLKDVQYAILRVGISRPAGTDRKVNISLNGTALQVPMEDCAPYLENETEFATTKIIRVDKSLLVNRNNITVSFPDGKQGGVGATVLRVGYQEITSVSENRNLQTPGIGIFPNPASGLMQVNLPNVSGVIKLQVVTLSGQLIHEEVATKSAVFIDTKILRMKGTYIVRVQTDKSAYNQKVIAI